jgi:hypothetical protein
MEGYEGAPSAFKEEVRLESDTSASKRLASFLDTDPMSTSGSAIPLRRKLSSIFVVGMHDVESVPLPLMIPLRTLPPPSSASSILPGLQECLGLRLSALFVALRLRLLEVTGRGCSALHHAHSRPCSRSRLCVYLASALASAFVLLVAVDHRSSFLSMLAPSVALHLHSLLLLLLDLLFHRLRLLSPLHFIRA